MKTDSPYHQQSWNPPEGPLCRHINRLATKKVKLCGTVGEVFSEGLPLNGKPKETKTWEKQVLKHKAPLSTL